jgi:hypothetical protein
VGRSVVTYDTEYRIGVFREENDGGEVYVVRTVNGHDGSEE